MPPGMSFTRADVEDVFSAGQMQMKYFELQAHKSKTVFRRSSFYACVVRVTRIVTLRSCIGVRSHTAAFSSVVTCGFRVTIPALPHQSSSGRHRKSVNLPALPHCTHACIMFVETSIVYNFNETHSCANSQAMVR